MRLVIALGFDDLGLHRLQLTVYAFNAPAISCYHSQGFSIEGTLRDSTRGSDGYWTSHIMGLLATDRFRRPAGAGDPLSSAPPGSPHIRPATLADAGPLARLLSELGYPHDGAAARARLSAWTDHADGAVLVADHDGDAVGFLAVCAYPFMQRGGRCARVMALAVAPEMRGHGLGHALMAAAMTWASERGCVAVEVTSSRTRVGAHAFYRRLGFDDLCWRSARFWRWLERDGAEPSPISPG
jgi:GNAT superfamily N-acetyltransferase